MSNMNERQLALKILEAIDEKDLFVNQILDDYFFVYQPEKSSRGFISRIIYGIIEHQIYIDFVINRFSKVSTEKMKPIIRHILRMSVYQILFMDKVPSHAAISEAVNLTKKRKLGQLSGFVNGVLRSIDRSQDEIEEAVQALEGKQYLSVK